METFNYVILGMLIVVSPGADFALVFRNSVSYGRVVGLYTGIGIGFGVTVHIVYSVFGISKILSHNETLFSVVQYAGAGYLIYLGVSGLITEKRVLSRKDRANQNIKQVRKYFIQGLICNVLNPKTMLFFLSIFTQIISANNDKLTVFAIGYGAYLCLLHMLWFCLVALLVTSEQKARLILEYGHIINRLCGLALIMFGGSLLLAN